MSRKGNCYDNAMKESFWATLKKELVHDMEFATFGEARAAIPSQQLGMDRSVLTA